MPVSNAPSVTVNLRARSRWIRFSFIPVLDSQMLTIAQHYDAKHRFECSECDREFKSTKSMNNVERLTTALTSHLLTTIQHYDAKHRFECSQCDSEFTTEHSRNQVRTRPTSVNNSTRLISVQHQNAAHSFRCAECGNKFGTKKSRDQVLYSTMYRAPVTANGYYSITT